jgi:NAD(P)H-dependent flavin oxidoreductase YrpB (nitropropane dioxygenase family)
LRRREADRARPRPTANPRPTSEGSKPFWFWQAIAAPSVPVLAAGGLADGRGLVAALARGAVGVCMRTRFVATVEARGHANYKRRITEIDEDGTVVTRAHSGKPNRMIRNAFTASWEGREAEIKPYPHQLKEVGERASHLGRIEGDVINGVRPCGQSAALTAEVPHAGDVVGQSRARRRRSYRPWLRASADLCVASRGSCRACVAAAIAAERRPARADATRCSS